MGSAAPAPVLVVDDDELVRGILQTHLERMRIPVATAGSAEEALARMETMHVAALVLDLTMPGRSGLDLAEFVRLFQSHLEGIPILIFTGTTPAPETLRLARRFDADVYLKPEGLQSLLSRLASLLDQGGGSLVKHMRAEDVDDLGEPAVDGSRDEES